MSNFWKKSVIIGLIFYVILVYLITGPWMDTMINGFIHYFLQYIVVWFIVSLILRALLKSKTPSWLKAALIGSSIYITLMAIMYMGSSLYGDDVGVMTDSIYLLIPSGYLHDFLFPNSNIISNWFVLVDLIFFAILAVMVVKTMNVINRRKLVKSFD